MAARLIGTPPRAILLDLLMATMDSISAWSSAAGDQERGLAWRDAVTDRMIRAGRYVPYEDLVVEAAAEHNLSPDAPERLWAAWSLIHRWPDASALEELRIPYAFVTNSSAELATAAAARSSLEPAFTLSAQEAGWYKPRSEIYRLACKRMGFRPGSIRFVAGAAYDAQGAARAGLRAFIVARRPTSGDLFDQITVVASLHDAVRVGGEPTGLAG